MRELRERREIEDIGEKKDWVEYYNVIKSHDQSHDRFNLIGTIFYHNIPKFLTYLTFQINLWNQLFKSTFWINLCNQPSHWIGGTTGLYYIASLDKHTYVEKYTTFY